ncbi:MAG TPA: SCO family protein [Candidatus Cybelea sp.]|nr:SCO family protein [Candidatus Cybelea sp.]
MQFLSRFVAIACIGLTVACSNGRAAPNFTLLDDAAKSWTLSRQRGKALLLTFGFTHCADTCPAMLARLAGMSRSLGAQADELEIVLVTVDPARDTTPVMHRFMARFRGLSSSRLVGLTGTAQQIEAVERAYDVWSQRIPGARRRGYDEAHSTVIFLIDSRGQVRALRDADDSEGSIARAVAEMLG